MNLCTACARACVACECSSMPNVMQCRSPPNRPPHRIACPPQCTDQVATVTSGYSSVSSRQLHAMCMRQPTAGRLAQAVNSGHSLEGFYVTQKQYVVQLRVRSGVKQLSVVVTSASGQHTYMLHTFANVLTAPVLAAASGPLSGGAESGWRMLRATLSALMPAGTNGDAQARLAVRFIGPGALCLDWVSLTPSEAWADDKTLRPIAPHLVKALRPLAPKFLRFPVRGW